MQLVSLMLPLYRAGVDKFLYRRPTRNFTCAPDRARKKLLMCFHQKFSQWGFYSANIILTSKIRYASKNNFRNSNVSSQKCSEEYAESIGFY